MADYDLEALSLGEPRKMQKGDAKAISTHEDRQKTKTLALDLGYFLAEPVGTEMKSSPAPAVAKHRRPENPALTWSGRGRKPQGVREGAGSRQNGDRSGNQLIRPGCVRLSAVTPPIA